jgi:hypothetical protein
MHLILARACDLKEHHIVLIPA